MPELPEVETVRLQLLHKVAGKMIDAVEIFHSKTVMHDATIEARLVGKRIAHIDRVGKMLIFSFVDDTDTFMLAHLKMTGQFFFVDTRGGIAGGGHSMTAADFHDLPNRHTRVAFHFTDRTTLFFNDMRLFGYTKVVDRTTADKARASFGPEPIDPNFDCDWFSTKLRQRKTSVKAVLLDQSFVAGLGNIYVDEALWRAKVRPMRRANKVTKAEATTLCTAARDVLRESIAVGGTTFQHFVDTDRERGNFTTQLKVFGKQDTPCPRCGTVIKKTRVAGRGTHYCPGCQK